MEATNQQCQSWSDQHARPYAERVRDLLVESEANNGAIGSVYERHNGSGGWTDARPDGPPNLATGSDHLALNTVSVQLAAILRGTLANDAAKIAACNEIAGQLAIILKLCVRPPMEG